MTAGEQGYASWDAIAKAAKSVAAANAKTGGADVNAQLLTMHFDRFLSRVFAEEDRSEWLLKGGTSMLARVPRSRSTKDVDLATSGGTLDEAEEALKTAAARDLGDHLTFELTRSRATGLADNQPGVETRRLTFTCRDAATGRKVGTVPVDVVVGHAPVGQVETIEPANRLTLPRPIVTHPYRLYPIADQVADKVTATLATNYPGGRTSSRVKDLVDLVVIARTQQLDLAELRTAIATKAALSHLELPEKFQIPQDWARTYRSLATDTPAAGGLVDVDDAAQLVSQLVNPALDGPNSPEKTWVPSNGWTDPDDAERAAQDAQEAQTGPVHVRPHTRSGWPINEHWRAARGEGTSSKETD